MKMMQAFTKDEKLNGLADTIELFANSASELEVLFYGNYDGGDFCSGLIFGRSGSKLLIEIAQRLVRIPDDHNPANKEQIEKDKRPKGRITDEFLKKDKQKRDQSQDYGSNYEDIEALKKQFIQ